MRQKKKRTWNLKSLIISHLRKIFFYSPLRKLALDSAKTETGLYKCAVTKKAFPINLVTVDHINPVVEPKKGWKDWNTFIERLFCDVSNLQVLSKDAHKKKTEKERKERKK